MGVTAKNRRKITINGENYVWYIEPDDDSPFHSLNIISEDKRLVLCCPLKTRPAYVISKGRVFQEKPASGCWERYLLPFYIPEAVTPKFVSEMILWATRGGQAVQVVWDENTIPIQVRFVTRQNRWYNRKAERPASIKEGPALHKSQKEAYHPCSRIQ